MDTVTLRPRRGPAAGWSAAALLLVASGVWFVLDSAGHPLAWLSLGLFLAVASYFVLQLLAPGSFAVQLTEEAVVARALWHRTEVPWEQVHLARVERTLGEPFLELHIREPSPVGDPFRTRALGILLPLGCDLGALHTFLAVRLGAGTPSVDRAAGVERRTAH